MVLVRVHYNGFGLITSVLDFVLFHKLLVMTRSICCLLFQFFVALCLFRTYISVN
jgi:hypothetical protein